MRKSHLILFLSLLLLCLLPATSPFAAAAPNASTTVSIYPTTDTWVNTTPGALTPDLNSTLLFVGSDEFTYEAYGLLQFDISSIPVDATITAAELNLWHEASESTNSLGHAICIHRVESDWNEHVTATTAPSVSKECQTMTTVEASFGGHSWSPLTLLVQGWFDGTHTNFGLAMKQEEYHFGYKAFQTEEGNVKPELKITYSLPEAAEPVPGSNQSLSVNPTSAKGGETVTLTGSGYTPGAYVGTIRWDEADVSGFEIPAGGSFSTQFEIPAGSAVGNHTISVCSLAPCATGEFEQTASVNFNVLPTPEGTSGLPYKVYLTMVEWDGGNGNPNPPAATPRIEIEIDSSIEPSVTSLPPFEDGGEPRPLGAVMDQNGNVSTFVQNEIFIETDNDSLVNEIVAAYSGEIMHEIDPAESGIDGLSKMYLIRVDPSAGDSSKLAEMLTALDTSGDIRSELGFSSNDAAGLMAIAGQNALDGAVIGVNWVGEPADPPDTASEATNGATQGGLTYSRDPYNWSYMNRGSIQDIGTADAWNVLIYGGKWDNRVKYAVLDKGFGRNSDTPDNSIYRSIVPGVSADGGRGGTRSPWHGTHVMQTAMAEADNFYGVAGVAHTVAEPINIYTGYDMFSSIISVVLARAEGAKVINMSYGGDMPAGVSFTVLPFEHTTMAVRASGALLFASAGNDYIDNDATDCFIVCWEETWNYPCENNGVICVGGIEWNSKMRARSVDSAGNTTGGSAWGSSGGVHIFAPYRVYRGADPDNPANGSNVGIISGTSFSSPYAAGVASLIWAADPSLSASQVWAIMRDTAHPSPDGSVPRYVNAYAAVLQATGTALSAEIKAPSANTTVPKNRTVSFNADVGAVLASSANINISWTSSRDGTLNTSNWSAVAAESGTESSFRTDDLSVGVHTITLRATGSGMTAVDTVQVIIENTRPTARIDFPAANAEFCVGETVNFSGSSFDPDQLSGIPGSGYSWSSSRDGSLGTGNPRGVTSLSIGNHTITLTVTDDGGLSQTDTTDLTILPSSDSDCFNNKPTGVVTSPANGSSIYADQQNGAGVWYKRITLIGQIGDTEDAISDLTVEWFDDVHGRLGEGNVNTTTGVVSITYNFTAEGCGTNHNITLRVTDSDGKMNDIVPYGFTVSLLC
ncbi:MAG: DNRLRE domain-containing protein [Anaerolineae bacterium]